MPIYEFQCKKCGKNFEDLIIKVGAKISKCPKCGGSSRKMVSHPSDNSGVGKHGITRLTSSINKGMTGKFSR